VFERSEPLSRRTVLRSAASAVALSAAGVAAGDSGGDDAPVGFEPMGGVAVDGANEAVVSDDGETAFVAVGSGFATVDLGDPTNPTVLARVDGLEGPEGAAVKEVLDVKYDDGQVLVPTGAQGGGPLGFYLYDVTDPANPTQVGDWFPTPEHGNHNAVLNDGVVYLTAGWDLDIVDVSGESFERLSTWQPSDWKSEWREAQNKVLHDLYVQDDRAYCSYWDAGTFVLDVSDPANPSFVSRFGDYTLEEAKELSQGAYLEPKGNDHTVHVNDDATLLAEGAEAWDLERGDDSGGPGGVTLYDVSDETNPKRLSHIAPPESGDNRYQEGVWTTSHNFELHGDRLYASWYRGGVSVHDVSDPANPERIAWWADPAEREFWTARVGVEGEFFVGASTDLHDAEPAVLTFPDDAGGRIPEVPEGVSWPTAGAYPTADDGEATTAQPTTTEATTAQPTTTEATTTQPTTTEATEETVAEGSTGSTTLDDEESDGESATGGESGSGSTPGFGVVAALAGLGVGAGRLLSGREDDD
jgi:hypothetical protein